MCLLGVITNEEMVIKASLSLSDIENRTVMRFEKACKLRCHTIQSLQTSEMSRGQWAANEGSQAY